MSNYFTHNILREFMSWEIFCIFMVHINPLRQFPVVVNLFEHVHFHDGFKHVGIFDGVEADNFRDGGTPGKKIGKIS